MDNSSGNISINIVNVVYGGHLDFYLNICLPSELSNENLLSLNVSSYCLYVLEKEVSIINQSNSIKRLRETIKTLKIIPIESLGGFSENECRYGRMIRCHNHFIRSSVGSGMIFLSPDMIWADGSFACLKNKYIDNKKKMVVMGINRISKESALPVINQLQTPYKPRELVKFALNHLHIITKSLIWSSPFTNTIPSILLFPVGNSGYILRGFHLHPIFVYPDNNMVYEDTIDGSFVDNAIDDKSLISCITDSDKMCVFEVSSNQHCPGNPTYGRLTVEHVSDWARRGGVNFMHKQFINNRIFIHSSDITNEWDDQINKSNEIVSRVLESI